MAVFDASPFWGPSEGSGYGQFFIPPRCLAPEGRGCAVTFNARWVLGKTSAGGFMSGLTCSEEGDRQMQGGILEGGHGYLFLGVTRGASTRKKAMQDHVRQHWPGIQGHGGSANLPEPRLISVMRAVVWGPCLAHGSRFRKWALSFDPLPTISWGLRQGGHTHMPFFPRVTSHKCSEQRQRTSTEEAVDCIEVRCGPTSLTSLVDVATTKHSWVATVPRSGKCLRGPCCSPCALLSRGCVHGASQGHNRHP